jgi:hypothetical protein
MEASSQYETISSNRTDILKNQNSNDFTQYLMKLNFYILAIISMFICGVLTNVLNLFILTRKRMKFKTTNRYLSALAICDLFVLFFSQLTLSNSFFNDFSQAGDSYFSTHKTSSIPYTDSIETGIIQLKPENDFYFETLDETTSGTIASLYYKWSLHIYPRVYPYTYPLAICFQIGAVWLSVCMSTDRFVAVHFPLKSLKFCTIKWAKRIIVAIFFFSFLYSLPRFFEYQTKTEIFTVNDNETYEFVHNDLTNLGKSTWYKKIIYVWMYVLLHSVVPLILLTLLNIALIFSLKKSSKFLSGFNRNEVSTSSMKYRTRYNFTKRRNGLTVTQVRLISTNNYKRQDITIMLIAVIVLFVLLQSPAVVCNCVYGFNYSHMRNDSLHLNLYICNVGNFFIMTNSTINFFTYFLFNRCFRKELFLFFQRIINCCKHISCSQKRQTIVRPIGHRQNSVNSTASSFIIRNNSKNYDEVRTNGEIGPSNQRLKTYKFNKFSRISEDNSQSNNSLKSSSNNLHQTQASYNRIPYMKKFSFTTPNKISNDCLRGKEPTIYYTNRLNAEQIQMKNFGTFNVSKLEKKSNLKFDFIDKYKADIVYL